MPTIGVGTFITGNIRRVDVSVGAEADTFVLSTNETVFGQDPSFRFIDTYLDWTKRWDLVVVEYNETFQEYIRVMNPRTAAISQEYKKSDGDYSYSLAFCIDKEGRLIYFDDGTEAADAGIKRIDLDAGGTVEELTFSGDIFDVLYWHFSANDFAVLIYNAGEFEDEFKIAKFTFPASGQTAVTEDWSVLKDSILDTDHGFTGGEPVLQILPNGNVVAIFESISGPPDAEWINLVEMNVSSGAVVQRWSQQKTDPLQYIGGTYITSPFVDFNESRVVFVGGESLYAFDTETWDLEFSPVALDEEIENIANVQYIAPYQDDYWMVANISGNVVLLKIQVRDLNEVPADRILTGRSNVDTQRCGGDPNNYFARIKRGLS